MKKLETTKTLRKLTLRRETLVHLNNQDLVQANGGSPTWGCQEPSPTFGCQ